MGRARNIKPGFFKNEDLAECTFAARLCFAGLWTLSDREGRLEDRPKRIKAELFAFDTVDAEQLLQELVLHGFIVRYETDGLKAIQILEFSRHQSPHYSESPSVIKPPDYRNTPGVLPESRGHHDPTTPGVIQDNSGSSAIIKKGSQPPDSLNPDSLNPDCPPIGGNPRKRATPRPPPDSLRPDSVPQQVWDDWLTLRKAKRAPVTQTVINHSLAEASKAGLSLEAFLRVWCTRGSQGLQADWLQTHERNQHNGSHRGEIDILANPKPKWALDAGFPNRFEAENDGCLEHTAKHFRNGKRFS